MNATIYRRQGRYKPLQSYESDRLEEENNREQNVWRDYKEHRTVFSRQEEINPSFQVKGSRTQIRPWQIHLLKKGDHVGWHRPVGVYWHHAIISDIDVQNCRIHVIHFAKVRGRITISKEWLDVRRQKGDFFRFDYSKETNILNPPDAVLRRANARVGERGYNLVDKNCEHFATYCKTGKEDCAQVHWAKGKMRETAQTFAADVGKAGVKLTCSVIRGATKQGYKGVVEGTAKVAGAEVLEKVGRASDWVGAAGIAAIETAHCAYDIYQMNKSRKAGKITTTDFKKCTTQRVSEGVFGGGASIGLSIAGGQLGGFVGGFIGSVIPVIGTVIGAAVGGFVGSVLGGAIGSVLGKACGTIFGSWFGRKLFG